MTIDPKQVAADLMCAGARDTDHIDVWAHIGQTYDIDVVEANIDASVANEVIDLISKAGIDLIWPDGTKNTELDAARVEIERLTAERDAQALAAEQNRSELDMVRTLDRQEIARLNGLVNELAAALTQSRDQAATYANEIGALTAENARLRPVVEAAKAWRGMRTESANVRPKPEAAALIAAVDALPKAATV